MKRSKFSLSNTKLLSCDMGELVPVGLTEVLPGDSIQQNTTCMVRFSPLLAPVMHPVHVQLAHWFVPHRLVWEDWEDFITGGPLGTDASVFPTITAGGGGFAIGSLADYLGVPTAVASLAVSALPFRGYALIFNEWYRDQDLQTELVIDETSGPDTTTNVTLQNASWEKDYFTSSRPWEQKGPAITIPIGTRANVRGIGTDAADNPYSDTSGTIHETGHVDVTQGTGQGDRYSATTQLVRLRQDGTGAAGYPDVYADLSNASAVTVNILREALALQRFEEARARFGSRYVEYLRYLGVRSSDARLQRPEYLGGGRYPVQFSEVLATAEGTNTDVGDLKGHGIGVARSNRYRRFFEEHGYIFTMLVVKPKTIYMQGLPRTWNRRVKEDFFQKELQHIGQQEVLNKEVYAAHASPDGTFGFQDRYDEYRRTESTIAGEFRDTLDFWHFGRKFSSDPALNASFVKCVPTEDPFAVPSADVLYIMCKHSIQARRIVAGSGQSFIY
ncbi:VP1 [Kummerowia striata microvirus]|nr:VP1 [Kummerowia striata microvirus]